MIDRGRAIVDTHQHLWDLSRFRLAWLAGAPDVLRRSYLPDDYRAATAGHPVRRSIYMEVDVEAAQQAEEAEWIAALCESRREPTEAAIISGRPAEAGFRDYVDRFRRHGSIRGVRQVLHGPSTPAGFALQDSYVRSIQYLGTIGWTFDLCLRPGELSDAAQLAQRCRETQLILDHCGNADPKALLAGGPRAAGAEHDADAWRRDIERLARQENVACKISGIVARVPDGGWGPEDLAPIVDHCLDCFGPDRVVFGSDWPVCLLGAPLADWIAALEQIVARRPDDERRRLWYDNALRIYGLPPARAE